MANNDMGTEQSPKPVIKSHAEAWIDKRGIKPPKEASLSPDAATELAQEAYDLFLDRQDLRSDVVRRSWASSEQSELSPDKTLEEKIKLIKSGNASAVLDTFNSDRTSSKIAMQNLQTKIGEVEQRLDEIFSTPSVYRRYQEGYHSQISARAGAREVRTLDEVVGQINLQVARLTRQAEIQNRTLTLSERQRAQESLALVDPINQRKRELLQDSDVFDQVRILELREYQRQLAKDRFAETPSRLYYIAELEKLWAQNKKALVTGPTGTGKTELVRHTSRKMFNLSPFEITGHREMTPFELLGRTGLNIKGGEGGDVYRPSKLVQAMVASEGKGGAFLYDEMDASPNEANIALKTILNDGPGDTISIQMDSDQRYVIGPNYSFTGTANVKSEKHLSRFEIDPAIVRVLEPMIVNYMPPNEAWDIAIASLMDRRGGIPLSREDALTTLKDLCDAAYWTQTAYLGEKVQTGSGANDFLKARAGASTGKPATLREAVLDPGKLRNMLKGWEASQMRGMGLREHLDEQLVRFVNNENYPPEDRYHLLEIFALKGFFRGREISEFKVSDLDQRTLNSWLGRDRERTKGQGIEYLRPERVAQLDPYGVLKRPVSADAEDLLQGEQNAREESQIGEDPMAKEAERILGRDFFGVEAIEKAFGMQLDSDVIPQIPFSKERLEHAKRQGQFLILRIGELGEQPLTMVRMQVLLQSQFDASGKGKVLYNQDWYKNESFFKSDALKPSWALVSKDPILNSTNKNYLEQTEALVAYFKLTFEERMPADYKYAILEFEKQKEDIRKILGSNWQEAAKKLSELKINQLARHSSAEALYDDMVYFQNIGGRWLGDFWTWTNARSSDGDLVRIGGSGTRGVGVGAWQPGRSDPRVGLYASLVD